MIQKRPPMPIFNVKRPPMPIGSCHSRLGRRSEENKGSCSTIAAVEGTILPTERKDGADQAVKREYFEIFSKCRSANERRKSFVRPPLRKSRALDFRCGKTADAD